ncbi:MAG: DUF2259 domain-containing protein [Treponema sp.]|jgi:predicted secreted protein|nr:DUF2259 domain-containing protein [Treponema sp.]
MRKALLSMIICLTTVFALFAGDVANFVDMGFTQDGKSYVFAQYGRTDKKYQGWAEIYTVNISENDFVDGGVFRTNPSAVTAEKTGNEVFEALQAKSFYYFKNLNCQKTEPEQILYVCDDAEKSGTDKIIFKDFASADIDNQITYNIQLVPTIIGSGKSVKSSFYILVEKKDAAGNIISTTKVGNPSIVRKGISGYKIERILCDKTKKNFIFVVEKHLEDESGLSIRYMVEASKIY